MTDFIIKTRIGTPIYTTSDKSLALSEVNRLRETYPGLYLIEVFTPPPVERRIWTDRQAQAGNVVQMRRAVS